MSIFPIKFSFKLVPRRSAMKAELEAQIAELQAKRDQLQQQLTTELAEVDTQLNAAVGKINKLMAEIPSEFHNLTQDVFDKLKEYFN